MKKAILLIVCVGLIVPNLSYSQSQWSSDPNDFNKIRGTIWGFYYGLNILENDLPDISIGFYDFYDDSDNDYLELMSIGLEPMLSDYKHYVGFTTYRISSSGDREKGYYCILSDLIYKDWVDVYQFNIDGNIATGEYSYMYKDGSIEILKKWITGVKIGNIDQDQNQPIDPNIIFIPDNLDQDQNQPIDSDHDNNDDSGCFIKLISYSSN